MAISTLGITIKVLGRLTNGKSTTVMTLNNTGIIGADAGSTPTANCAKFGDILVCLPEWTGNPTATKGYKVAFEDILKAAQKLTSATIYGYVCIMNFFGVSSTKSPGNVLSNDEVFKDGYADTFSMTPILRVTGANINTGSTVTTNLRHAADPFETADYQTKLQIYKTMMAEYKIGATNNPDSSIYFSVSKDVIE